jgi:hypothetical protein
MTIAPFPLPAMFTAWGTATGGQYENSYGVLRDKSRDAGMRTIGLQASQCRREQVDELKKEFFVAGWDEPGRVSKADFASLGFQGYIGQVETADQYAGVLRELQEDHAPGLPKGVISTYGGLFDPTDPRSGRPYAALKALGVSACFVECYASENAVWSDLPRMIGQGIIYGIPADDLVPAVGVYRGELPPIYKGVEEMGREFGLYIAEPMSDMQWSAWGGVNVAEQVYYWRLTAGTALLHQEQAKTYGDGTTGLGKMLDWMKTSEGLGKIRAAHAVRLDRVLV